jgi:Tfp pilus assembly protein FimT
MRRPRPRPEGHSLIDLLIVLSILAVLLALGAPALGRAHARYAAMAAARRLRVDLAQARMQAVLRGRTVTVAIDTLAGAWVASDDEGVALLSHRLPSIVEIRTTAHRQSIPFTSRGTTNLYSTTWVGPANDPGGAWHGIRVAPSGSIARP